MGDGLGDLLSPRERIEVRGSRLARKLKKSYTVWMSKISTMEIVLLVLFAFTADILSFIPIINIVMSLVVTPVLFVYYKIKRVPTYPTIIAGVIEVVPVLSMLPAFTAGVLAVILIDKFGASKLGSATTKDARKKDLLQQKRNAETDLMREEARAYSGGANNYEKNRMKQKISRLNQQLHPS